MTRIASPLFIGFIVFALGRSALADKPAAKAVTEKAAKEKAAKKACATGDYQKGADILADLFVDTNETVYVYNQGRCYQQNNRWEQAISRFREYLRKTKNLSESEREETQRQIDECQESLTKNAPVAPPPVATTSPVPVAQGDMPAAIPQPAPHEVESKPAPPASEASRGKGLRVAGIILTSAGVLAVGTGVGLTLKANSLSTTDYSRSRENERSSLRTWALVSYGVGAAAIATGVVLYVVGWPNQSSSSVALLPLVAPDGASLSLKGRF